MASTYLSKTFSTPTNRRKWTWSAWVKKSTTGTSQALFAAGADGNNQSEIKFLSDNIHVFQDTSGSNSFQVKTNALYRDVNAWYHIVVAVDTTQATAADRLKIYVNGTEQTSLALSTYPSQNFDGLLNNNIAHYIGKRSWTGTYFDGLMAHVHFIDGTQYAASDFGETESTSGIWKPKTSVSVTYGTNGFFLKFQDSSSLGDDSSGNTNDFTLSGSGKQILDTPSNVFATLNPLDNRSGIVTTSNGNLTGTGTTAAWRFGKCSLGITKGKWYFEAKQNGSVGPSLGRAVGWVDQNINGDDNINSGTPPVKFYARQGGTLYNNDSGTASYFSLDSDGDIIGVAFDMDNGKMWFSKNGTWQNSGGSGSNTTTYSSTTLNTSYPDITGISLDTGSGGAGVFVPTIVCYSTGASQDLNFGNGYFGTTAVSSAENDDAGYGKFEYSPPTGFYALCTKNINNYG